jgi:hypothetical protein
VWRPVDINNIEVTASRALLQMAAKFRQRYLRNFYELGKANLRLDGDVPQAYVVMAGQPHAETVSRFLEILVSQGIEIKEMTRELWVKHSKVGRISRNTARQFFGIYKSASEEQRTQPFRKTKISAAALA